MARGRPKKQETVSDDDEYVVEQVLDKREKNGKVNFKFILNAIH